MDTPDTTGTTASRPQRRYGTDEQATALAVLAECGNNAEEAARRTGIPASTLKEWRAGEIRPCPPELVAQRKSERSTRWADIADAAQTQVLARLPEASARDAAVIAGIAEDKRAMLDGDSGPALAPEDAARLDLFRARYAAAQAIAITVNVHAPAQPQALVPVQVVEPPQVGGASPESGG